MQNTPSIGHILEMPDLQVDALCTDQDGYLSFLSVWGRDTATQELLARLTLPANETASLIQGFNLRLDNKSSTSTNKILVIPDLLEKTFSRTFGRTKFGSINNLWLYDSRAIKADKANHTALIVLRDNGDTQSLDQLPQHPEFGNCLQQLISVSPVPILEHWAPVAFKAACELEMVSLHTSYLGKALCAEIALKESVFQHRISELICNGTLTVNA